jgi:cell division protein FtsB
VTARALGSAAVVLIAGALVVYGSAGAVRVWQMTREIRAVERDLADLRARSARLAETVERLRNDPQAIEQLAREELGMTRPGESVLKFPSTSR